MEVRRGECCCAATDLPHNIMQRQTTPYNIMQQGLATRVAVHHGVTLLHMAWTQTLPSGKHRGLYRHDGKVRSAGTYTLKRQALQAAQTAEDDARTTTRKHRTIPTVTAWLPEWRTMRRQAEDKTRDNDESRIRIYIEPRFGTTKLDDITPGDVQAWINQLSEAGAKPSTVRGIKSVMSSIMRAAVREQLVTTNPCAQLDLPRIPPSPDRYLTDQERTVMLSALDEHDQMVFQFLCDTGLRWGEFAGLHWDCVDLSLREIRVTRSYVAKYKYFKPPKSYAARRVPLTDTAITILRSLPTDTPILDDLEYREVPKPMSGLVFTNSVGHPMLSAAFGEALKAAARVSKIRHVRPHDLRHTYGSRLVQNGVGIYEVKALMGHSTVTTTERYARVNDSGWDRVRSALQ